MVGKKIAQLQHSEKFVKEIGAPKMRQPSMVTGDFEVSGRSSHPETYLTKSEVSLRLAKTDETLINRGFGASRRSQNAPDPGDTKPKLGVQRSFSVESHMLPRRVDLKLRLRAPELRPQAGNDRTGTGQENRGIDTDRQIGNA